MAKKYIQIDTNAPYKRTWFIFELVIWIISFIMKTKTKAKIVKKNKLPKPPYILLSTHASMLDFYMALMVTFPHPPYWISTVEEFIPRHFIFRRIGVMAKRKFTNDPKSALSYMQPLKKGKILIIYPEARYSFIGEPERIDKSLGRFIKAAKVPVVLAKPHGNYLYCPQWSDRKERKITPIITEVETIFLKENIAAMSAADLQAALEEKFHISEEDWMKEHNILNTYNDRAIGLQRILYKCPHCGTEFEMSTESHFIKCNHCGVTYDYLENGQLQCINNETKFDYVSKWYKWEKECVKQEVLNGTYHIEDDVRVEKLMGMGIGFVPLEGKYHLTHTIEGGIVAKGVDNDFIFERPSLQSFGLHIEYNYEDRGAFLELADQNDTYFVYPLKNPLVLTKMHFATEHIYDYYKSELKKEDE